MNRFNLGFLALSVAVPVAVVLAPGCSGNTNDSGTRDTRRGDAAPPGAGKCVAGPPGATCEDVYACGQAHCKAEWDTCTRSGGACKPLFDCAKACPCDDDFETCSTDCAMNNQSVDCGMCLADYSTCLTENCKSEVDACTDSSSGSGGGPSIGSGGRPPIGMGGQPTFGAGGTGSGGRGNGGAAPTNCDTCVWARDGACDVPDYCPPGTDCTDCGPVTPGSGGRGSGGAPPINCDTCQWARDAECDEPTLCAPGTDCSDCGVRPGAGGSGSGGAGPGTVPADLVGTWLSQSGSAGTIYTFGANGSFSYAGLLDNVCSGTFGIDTLEIIERGLANASGNQLVLSPTSGTSTTRSCSGTVTNNAPDLTPEVFTFSVQSVRGEVTLRLVGAASDITLVRQ